MKMREELPSRRVIGIVCLAVLVVFGAAGAETGSDTDRKVIRAVRVESGTVTLDGRLNDVAWQEAFFVTDFVQKEPVEGAPPQEKTAVAIVYDDDALYIGARMYSADPSGLRMHLDRRDTQGPAEQFIVSLDTYLDRRTAYGFGVNTSGVRFERYHPRDTEYPRDYTFDPVWEARTAVDDSSWTCEMRIPWSQLRFVDRPEQVWGVNFNRWIPSRNEDVYWILVPRNATGWASRFGNLVGIAGIPPSRRIELLPYVAGDGNLVDHVQPGDPFARTVALTTRLGGDLKMGIGPNLTLDATFNPDFGQVGADAAEVNLSAFETFFPEKRPFFTEGRGLFEPLGPRYFYSRRIGRPPQGRAGGDYVDRPDNTTILGAAKLSGRLASGTSVGLLTALTDRETARSYFVDGDSTVQTEVEPLTWYGVARVQQEFGADASTVGMILTGVVRDIDADSPLRSRLTRTAWAGGVDWTLRFDHGKYRLSGFAGFSRVTGDTARIRTLQMSSARYYQRPDADHVALDPLRTSLSGFTGSLRFSKDGGRHWLYGAGVVAESPGFELNDAGLLRSADDIDSWVWLTYRETVPSSWYHRFRFTLGMNTGWNFGGVRQYAVPELSAEFTWKNFWRTRLSLTRRTRALSDSRTRGGPLMLTEAGWGLSASVNSNFAATSRYSLRVRYEFDELDGWRYVLGGELATRLGDRISVSLQPGYQREEQPRQYVTAVAGTAGARTTYGTRYVFARIDRVTVSAQVRASYFFTPDLSLELYAEPFAASGRYYDYGELAAPRTNELSPYGQGDIDMVRGTDGRWRVTDGSTGDEFTIPDPDFHTLSFRSNLVLRWEFTPGSTLYLVWQRNVWGDGEFGRPARVGDLWETVGESGENFLAVKVSYWLPIS